MADVNRLVEGAGGDKGPGSVDPPVVVGAEGDVEIIPMDDGGDKMTDKNDFATQLLNNPEVLAALQRGNHLDGSETTSPYDYIKNLPVPVKRRLKALKKLQFETIKIESKFYEELHALECRFAEQYSKFYDRRRDIVNGTSEPTDSDCDWLSEEEEGDEDADNLAMQKMTIVELDKDGKEVAEPKNETGVPDFWSTIFKNVDMLAEIIQEHDEPILKHLQDIKVTLSQSNPTAFTLEFYFSPNDYFTNSVLTKQYLLRSEPDPDNPLDFEGPVIVKSVGCNIDWKSGKNVTVKLIKKTLKHKGRGTRRTVTQSVPKDSFFNFFNPPIAVEGEEMEEDQAQILALDFEIGHFIRERIIPRAVLYFTGEALADDEDYADDEEEGDNEDDDDDDCESDDGDGDTKNKAAQV